MNLNTNPMAGPVLPDAPPAPREIKTGHAPGAFAQALRQQQGRPAPEPKDAAVQRPKGIEASDEVATAADGDLAEPATDPAMPDAAWVDPRWTADRPVDPLADRWAPAPAPTDNAANPAQALLAAFHRGAVEAGVAVAGKAQAQAQASEGTDTDPVAPVTLQHPRPADAGGARTIHGLQAAATAALSQDAQVGPEPGSNPAAGALAGPFTAALTAALTAATGPSVPTLTGSTAQEIRPTEPAPVAPEVLPSASIDPEVGSPGFAPALGARVALLVRDGVQEARLALHPADMGPIAVQIALDGQAASIHFQAEQAATRTALEASLPALAAALREGGITLTGGGVSQQGRGGAGPRDDTTPAAARRARGDEGAVQEVALRRTPVARGVVDLYA